MHNKRIGRDDLLKIEVRGCEMCFYEQALICCSGRVLPHPLPGVSTRALAVIARIAVVMTAVSPAVVVVVDVTALQEPAAEAPPLVVPAANTHPVKMIAESATMTAATVSGPAALMTETAR